MPIAAKRLRDAAIQRGKRYWQRRPSHIKKHNTYTIGRNL